MHTPQKEDVQLYEQETTEVLLEPSEADYLETDLRFDVFTGPQDRESGPEVDAKQLFRVNPRQYVGHFLLPTGRTVVISPKIPAANVFRMLAYVYASEDRDLFLDADVLYERDTLLFEPLVEIFNQLVTGRARRGLVQDYIQYEDNLNVLRGNIHVGHHIHHNVGRHADRLFCRFYENTCDIEDNQIIKWTVWYLLRSSLTWTEKTERRLRANLHQLEPVTLSRPARAALEHRHYHRLNEDYRLIHNLCRLFLDNASISEGKGDISFRGFIVDMNHLFERFVSQAFMSITTGTNLAAQPQKRVYLSEHDSEFSVLIQPDMTIRHQGEVVAIVDAKYKRLVGVYENHDIYQMLSYGTALSCTSTCLFYPTSEYESEGRINVKYSPVAIDVRRVDLSSSRCVNLAEESARSVVAHLSGSKELSGARHPSRPGSQNQE